MFSETLHQRALICRWLSTLFNQELEDTRLQTFLDSEAIPVMDLLSKHESLVPLTRRFNDALGSLSQREQPSRALAADFTTLFLLDERNAAPPYASLYQSQGQGQTAMFHLKATERMEVRMKAAGYRDDQQRREPADHLAIMLDYLATVWKRIASVKEGFARRELLQGLEQFIRAELAWLPRFHQRCESIDTASDFYPCLAAIVTQYRVALLDTLRRDRQTIENNYSAS